MFKVKDKFLYEKYKSWTITSVRRTSSSVWKCTTKKGKFLVVRLSAGMVMLSASEREHESIAGGEIVAFYSNSPSPQMDYLSFSPDQITKMKQMLSLTLDLDGGKFSFEDIASFFDWRYEEDDVWDNAS